MVKRQQQRVRRGRKVRKMDTQVNILCLCQHFAVWYEAIKNDSPPDFGAPCESCRNQENCRRDGFPWMDLILPILDYQGIKINLDNRNNGVIP